MEMTSLLSDEELKKLTGYEHADKQREILDRGGISYILDREGRPMTTWAHINAVLNGQIHIDASSEERPDFGAI